MNVLGNGKKILGMDIKRDRLKGKLLLSRCSYMEKVIRRLFMHDSKFVITHLRQHFKLSNQQSPTTKEDKDEMSKVPYANVVGYIMYNMVCSRLDLSYAINVANRFMSSPGKL